MRSFIEKMNRSCQLYELRYWSDSSAKVQRAIFRKSEVIIGKEKDCDLKLKSCDLLLRLDVAAGTVLDLRSGEESEAPQEKLIFLEGLVFEWRPFRIPVTSLHRKIAVGLTSLFAMLIFFSYFQWDGEPELPACTSLELQVATGHWRASRYLNEEEKDWIETLQQKKKSFKEDLSQRDLVQARSQLNRIQELVQLRNLSPACGVSQSLLHLESQLAERIILEKLKQKEFVEASQDFIHFQDRLEERVKRLLEKRLVKSARSLVRESWILESRDPSKSYELQKAVQMICENLGRHDSCLDSASEASL